MKYFQTSYKNLNKKIKWIKSKPKQVNKSYKRQNKILLNPKVIKERYRI